MNEGGLGVLNWIDFIFVGLIGLSLVISLFRGLVREIISLLTWVIGFWAAFSFSSQLAIYLNPIGGPTAFRLIVAFIMIFLAVWVIGFIVNALVSRVVHQTSFGASDRLLGGVFGILRGVLLVFIIILLVNITQFATRPAWMHSWFVKVMTPWTQVVHREFLKPKKTENHMMDTEQLHSRFELLRSLPLDDAT